MARRKAGENPDEPATVAMVGPRKHESLTMPDGTVYEPDNGAVEVAAEHVGTMGDFGFKIPEAE